MSLKEEILALVSQRVTLKPVKVFGKDLFIKPLTGKAVVEIDGDKDHSYAMKLVSRCLTDDAGNPLFTPTEIGTFPADEFLRVFEAVNKVADFGDGAVEKKGKS